MTHQLILESRSIAWTSESDCAAFAASLATKPAIRDAFIALEGPLGAGKTTFARHLLRALGAGGRIKSPTYALLEPYDLPGLHASHLDFYRFSDPREWVDAGLREVFEQPGLKLVEWPEKAGSLLPNADLRLCIMPRDDGVRDVAVHAQTPRGVELLA
ncbi:MAG TPA: tRNA (adenosine(37)-N6)-threonylcarbamoyltransferase complex ATPase subunit type 1 TsaE [Burkholderiaceae bacterium]|nr:tRNA (adenosine(37)-N6)-threonylcarbamoyltransferase complex ATPase subunit type 1 TsaE [Burkholderiaceae bacterium]